MCMLKTVFLLIGLCLMAETSLAQLSEPYVRKKIEPNFFIPEGALAGRKPEKINLPRYNQGQTTAKRISSKMPENITPPSQEPSRDEADISNQPQAQTGGLSETTTPLYYTPTLMTNDNNLSSDNPATETTESPNYQKMYQDYLKDLNSIVQSGKSDTSQIDKDLSNMDSEKRIQIDKEFNAQRNVKEDILKALE